MECERFCQQVAALEKLLKLESEHQTDARIVGLNAVRNDMAALDRVLTNELDNLRSLIISKNGGPYLTVAAHDLYIKVVEADLRILREARERQVGKDEEISRKASRSEVAWALVIAALGAVTGLLALFKHG